MSLNPQTKTFLLGLSISVLILVSFFGGALADRVFVVRPLDWLLKGHSLATFPARLNTSSPESGSATTEVVADVSAVAADSVVTVSIKKQQRVIQPSALGIFGGGFATSRVEEIKQDIGTGFVVEGSGLIVTNKHVVGDPAATYTVIDKNDQEYPVTNIYRDPVNDLAIIKVEGATLPALPLGDSSQLRVGQSVIAIGTALGEFRHTVTTGVVSGLGRGIQAIDQLGGSVEALEGVIQTDAAINPGNSGGPLLDRQGRVIGVNVAVSAAGQNIGFAIPINVIKASLENFNQTGQFDRPMFGVQYRMISQQAALFNNVPQGAYVLEVVPNSAAAEAGIQVEDIITQFDGQAVKDVNLASLINQKKIGDKVEVVFWRDGQEKTSLVTLQAAQ